MQKLDKLIKLADINFELACEWDEQNIVSVSRHMKIWGDSCGAPRSVYLGHLVRTIVGRAYVRFYDIGDSEFERLINQMKSMKDHALIRHVDAPPQFRGVFEI